MNKFIESKNTDYKNDPFYLEVVNLIGFNKPKIGGSYVKYGKDKACDLDMSENMSYEDFNEYLKKIILNKDKFILLNAYFNEPYHKLQKIKDKLGYLDGNFKLINNIPINEDINNLPDELKHTMKETTNYFKLKLLIEKNLYPKWSLKKLIKGEIKYYDQLFKISDNNFDFFYIEILYENFRVSNYIIFRNLPKDNMFHWEINDLFINDELSYFKLLKKLMVFIKISYFNNIIRNEESIRSYNTIFEFIENNGILHYSNCIINNYLDNYKRKINKYTKKYQKYPDSTKYQKIINYYQNKHDEYYEKYSINVKEINDKSKPVYFQISQLYSIFLSKYVKIY